VRFPLRSCFRLCRFVDVYLLYCTVPVYVKLSCSKTTEMLFSLARLPLSLLTLIFAFAINTTVAKGDGNNNAEVKYVDIFAVDYPIVAYIHDSVCPPLHHHNLSTGTNNNPRLTMHKQPTTSPAPQIHRQHPVPSPNPTP
jgi:hypothetical protein